MYAWTSDQSFNAPDSNYFGETLDSTNSDFLNYFGDSPNYFGNSLNSDSTNSDSPDLDSPDNTQSSRDDNSVLFNSSKSKSTNTKFPQSNYDSSLRSMLETSIEPTILNEYISLDIYGRSLPIGFAEYVDTTITALNYNYYFIPGWRVAIPRVIPMDQVNNILNTIFYKGPQSAGFIRIGDTLVPLMLSPGERMALAQST